MKKYLLLFILITTAVFAKAQTQLWGMTHYGGTNDNGVIFKMNLDGSGYMVVHNFYTSCGKPDGSLLYASDGNLYGMSTNSFFFKYQPFSNTFSIIDSTGFVPHGTVIEASNGNLYGMTERGGTLLGGEIFKYNLNSFVSSEIHSFDLHNDSLGSKPYGDLIEATDGKFYGMTANGGGFGQGVIFSFDTASNIYTKLHDFGFSSPGLGPFGSLIQATNGLLYGTTPRGGIYDLGTLFSFNPISNAYTTLFDFDSITGNRPWGGTLKQALDGNLYGLLYIEGQTYGTLYRYNITSGLFKVMHYFDDITGMLPKGSLFQASDGKLYGMTYTGGTNNKGVIFSYNPTDSSYIQLKSFNGMDGLNPTYGTLIELPTTPNLGIPTIATSQSSIEVSPNPATSTLTIFSESDKIKDIHIYSVLGVMVNDKRLTVNGSANNQYTINISQLQNGMYFIEATTDKGVVRKKFIKQ